MSCLMLNLDLFQESQNLFFQTQGKIPGTPQGLREAIIIRDSKTSIHLP